MTLDHILCLLFLLIWKGVKIPEICKKQIGVSPTYR